MTDARGVTVDYTYDALNRLVLIDYAGTALDITYNYDAGTNGKGRLTSMTDAVGSITYTYDARDNLLTETQIIDGHTFNLAYTYDGAGNLLTMTYPSGQVVTYTRDAGGRVTDISRFNGTTDTLASNITYEPFGPMKSMTLGNGIQVTKTYDLAYRVTDIVQGSVMDRDYSYDAAGNITGIVDLLSPTKSQAFGYDNLDRLTGANGIYGSEAYVYDAVGNRTQSTINSVVINYGYSSTSNRLTSVDSTTIGYDAAGNITDDGSQQYVYDDRNRMVGANQGVTALGDYYFNGRGERVIKTIGASDAFFVFDQLGRLVAEADDTGSLIREYVYVQGMRMAITEGSSIFYFHVDHLGTPQEITNSTGSGVWNADYEPFGSLHAESGSLSNQLRFPGQYEDFESGLNYNYFRTYDSGTGRYLESDPLGLAAGLNTYSYVSSTPTMQTDKYGLYEGGGISELFPGLDHNDYLDLINDMEYRPPSPYETCVARCYLKRRIICLPLHAAGFLMGQTVAAVASIPTGGAAFGVISPWMRAAGSNSAGFLCRQTMYNVSCEKSCESLLDCESDP